MYEVVIKVTLQVDADDPDKREITEDEAGKAAIDAVSNNWLSMSEITEALSNT